MRQEKLRLQTPSSSKLVTIQKLAGAFFDHESMLDIKADVIWSTSNQLISATRRMRVPLEQKARQVCVSAVLVAESAVTTAS